MSGGKMFRVMLFISLGFVILVSGSSCGSKDSGNTVNPIVDDDDSVLNTYEAEVPVVCSNNLTPEIFELAFKIKATSSEPVLEGIPVELTLTGTAYFPTDLLNLALLIDGLDGIWLEHIKATFVVRSGATGDPVEVGSSIGTDVRIPIPVVTDPQTCALAPNPERCVVEPMEFDLSEEKGTFTPGAKGTNILIGLEDSRIPLPDWDEIDATDEPGPNGMRVKLMVGETKSEESLGLECSMGRLNDSGTPEPLSDGELMTIPIE